MKELHLDGTEMPEKPQAPKKPRVQKAKSVVNVPDIYLEDAVQYGMLDFSAYQDLQKQRKKFVTLRDAWLEANKNSEALKKIASAANFDVSFSSGSYEEVYDDAIYQTAEKQEITLDEAVEKGWISQTTADILENGTGEENDSSQILLLSEAFELVAVDPEYLSEYRDPNLQRDVTLSAAKQRKIVTEMKNAYAKFSQENAQESLVDSINKSWRAFGREQIDLLDRNIAFRRHDPERAVIKSLENIVENQNAEIIGARPEMLSRAP